MPEPTPRDWDVFAEAVELSAPERTALLAKLSNVDPSLARRVEALLAAHDQAGTFLADPPPAATPTHIGRYRLIERIGEGGFGVVYLAEQEEPVRRQVALKVIKLGMDTASTVARFEGERQALALMDHPNIAKVLDGGATDTGRPYFVMELVRGVPITRYCSEAQLTMQARLELFIQVCHAVQHAHQKGIIHRDLKPSNILVALSDHRPTPKVIDFGIAKALEQRITEMTILTQFHQFLGTPAYVSPEQTAMGGGDVDTRSDIYSLGVLLYELLTDHPPFDKEELLSLGFDEVYRIIRERDPPSPSNRLAALAPEVLTQTAQRRHLAPRRLASELRGDLDRIVMKCLQKSRNERYETASALAADLGRHLADEPILARAPSPAYRWGKFVRRHRVSVVAGALVAVTLVAGAVFGTTQAIRASRAERNERAARQAAERAATAESRLRIDAEHRESEARRLLYASDIRLAYQAWDEGNLARADTLLASHVPLPGHPDERSFEYFHLKERCRGEQTDVLHGSGESVNALALSPDEKWLAGRTDTAVHLWSLSEPRTHVTWGGLISYRALGSEPDVRISFSPDSRHVLLETEAGLELGDVRTSERTALATGPGWFASFSPTKPVIAFLPLDDHAASGPGLTRVWDAARDREVAAFDAKGLLLSWSPSGHQLLTGRWLNRVTAWDTHSWKEARTYPLKTWVSAARLSPDGSRLAVSSWQGEVHVLMAEDGREVGRLPSHDVRGHALDFSPDGRWIATASDNQLIQLWDAATLQPALRLRGHHGKVHELIFTRNSQTLISASQDGTVRLWSPGQATRERIIPNALPRLFIHAPVFSPDGRWVGMPVSGPSVQPPYRHESLVWNLPDGGRSWVVRGELIASSEDGTQVATVVWKPHAELQVWRIHEDQPRAVIPLDQARDAVGSNPQLSPDGTLLIQQLPGKRLAVMEAGTGRTLETLPSSSGAAAFLPGETSLVYANGASLLWWQRNPARVRRPMDCPAQVTALALSADGGTLAASLANNQIVLWDLASEVQTATLAGHQGQIYALAFAPDGRMLASGSEDRTVKFWRIDTRREVASLVQPRAVYRLSFSADGETLALGDIGAYRLWRGPGLSSAGAGSPPTSHRALPRESVWLVPDRR